MASWIGLSCLIDCGWGGEECVGEEESVLLQ